tara:strand:+ start:8836 stop:9297 length:462 start_codon:yes stop_codon:yes gene_type:complete
MAKPKTTGTRVKPVKLIRRKKEDGGPATGLSLPPEPVSTPIGAPSLGIGKKRDGGNKQTKDSTGSTQGEKSFGQAFRAAKDAGKKTFMWKGKSYHTKTKDEVQSEKYKANKPKRGGYPGITPKQIKKMTDRWRNKKRTGGARDPFLEPGIENI